MRLIGTTKNEQIIETVSVLFIFFFFVTYIFASDIDLVRRINTFSLLYYILASADRIFQEHRGEQQIYIFVSCASSFSYISHADVYLLRFFLFSPFRKGPE